MTLVVVLVGVGAWGVHWLHAPWLSYRVMMDLVLSSEREGVDVDVETIVMTVVSSLCRS